MTEQLPMFVDPPLPPVHYVFAKCLYGYHTGYGLAVVNVHTGEEREYGCPGEQLRGPYGEEPDPTRHRLEVCVCVCHGEEAAR